jgi:hypothetical protein
LDQDPGFFLNHEGTPVSAPGWTHSLLEVSNQPPIARTLQLNEDLVEAIFQPCMTQYTSFGHAGQDAPELPEKLATEQRRFRAQPVPAYRCAGRALPGPDV